MFLIKIYNYLKEVNTIIEKTPMMKNESSSTNEEYNEKESVLNLFRDKLKKTKKTNKKMKKSISLIKEGSSLDPEILADFVSEPILSIPIFKDEKSSKIFSETKYKEINIKDKLIEHKPINIFYKSKKLIINKLKTEEELKIEEEFKNALINKEKFLNPFFKIPKLQPKEEKIINKREIIIQKHIFNKKKDILRKNKEESPKKKKRVTFKD